jgi:hypothetical protein
LPLLPSAGTPSAQVSAWLIVTCILFSPLFLTDGEGWRKWINYFRKESREQTQLAGLSHGPRQRRASGARPHTKLHAPTRSFAAR